MKSIDRGKGICPVCRATVRLVAFRGSTTDSRSGGDVIGRHRRGNVRALLHCPGEQQRQFRGEP